MRYYTSQIGPFEISGWQPSDSRAVKVAERWTRRFFARAVGRLPRCSMARQVANEDPKIEVYRHHVGSSPSIVSFAVAKIFEARVTP